MELKELDIYRIAREISRMAWTIYSRLEWQERKIMGDQWIESIDSVGANIAEGFGRYHYLDRNKFNLNARGSLLEARHWTSLLYERKKITDSEFEKMHELFDRLHAGLNKYIQVTRELGRR